jgi:uncharacterized protein with HEPN domain
MKPQRDADQILLSHIQDCIERIQEYTGGDQAAFVGSHLVQDAVIRNLQTLAESTQRLSDALKAREPAIPWSDIAGFRNVLTHGYLGLDTQLVWSVVEQDLPGLAQAVARLRTTLDEGTMP